MTIAVSGAGSMVGKRIVKRFGASGPVVSVGRGAGSDILLDLRDPLSDLPPAGAADVMIHCAATFGGNRIEEVIENEIVNAVGSLRVAALAAAMGCRQLINISSISALPENVSGSSYGLSKRHGQENLELACRELSIPLTTLLVTQIYDDTGEARKHQPMFYRILDCARAGRAVDLYGDNDPLRNLLFVEDLVTVIGRVVDRSVTGTYNVVHPVSYTVTQIATMAFEAYATSAAIVRHSDKPGIPTVWYPSDMTLYNLIDYQPETDLRSGIARIRQVNSCTRS